MEKFDIEYFCIMTSTTSNFKVYNIIEKDNEKGTFKSYLLSSSLDISKKIPSIHKKLRSF